MGFDRGLAVEFENEGMRFVYGPGVFGCEPEHRRLDAIRASLRDPECDGPDPVYSIAMDVGRVEDKAELERRMLLFGAVAYSAGRLGREPVRSQGHVHAVAPHCGWSTPEVFEIWEGRAVVYAQERMEDDPGCCVAVEASVGEQVVVPPGWGHYVVNADPAARMVFGALCDRQYGFEYHGVRARGGMAWFPIFGEDGAIRWERNARYGVGAAMEVRGARSYPELGLRGDRPLYGQFVQDARTVQWVSEPGLVGEIWKSFRP